MKEQAEREHRSLNDVVSERYGVRTDGTLAASAHSHAHFRRHIRLREKAIEQMRTLHNIQFIVLFWTKRY